jgi:outer membrane protein TolC
MIYGYLLFLICSFTASASELNEFLKLSYANDPQIKKILNDKTLLNHFVTQGLEGSETLISISSETGYVSDEDENNSNLGVEISKKVLNTGSDISVSHSKTSKPGEEGTTSSIVLEQSLLQNSFGSTTRLQIKNLNLEKNIKELESIEELEDYLLVNINKYLKCKKSLMALKLAESQLTEARKIQTNLNEKFKSKVATKADLNRGELLLLNREENLVERIEDKKQFEIELVNATGKSGLLLLSNKELDSLLNKMLILYEKKKKTVKKEQIRSFIIAKNTVDVSDHNIKLAGDKQTGSLNLVVGFNRLDNTKYSTITKQDETVVGLNYTIPIGDDQAEANTQIAKIQKISNQYKQMKTNNDFESSLEQIKSDISSLSSKLKLNIKKVQLTQSLLKEETKRYSIGQLSLDKLIEIKYDSFDIENENLEIKVQYIENILRWLSETDNLIGIESQL